MKTEFDRLQTDFAWSHHICVLQKSQSSSSAIILQTLQKGLKMLELVLTSFYVYYSAKFLQTIGAAGGLNLYREQNRAQSDTFITYASI